VILINPHPDIQWIPALDVSVEPGGEVEATGDVAKSLVAQGWEQSKKPKGKE